MEKSNACVIFKSESPPGKVILSAIILKLKRDEHGLFASFKRRLVTVGKIQSDHLGLFEVYDSVTCIQSVRILFAFEYALRLTPHHDEIKGALLYALLSEADEVWIKLPRI